MSFIKPKDWVPGPGAYNPTSTCTMSSSKISTIRPLPAPPQLPDPQDKEAVLAYERKKKFMDDLRESKHRRPELGCYTPRGTFDASLKSPRSRSQDALFGTPRSERTAFNVDLYDTSKRPGPGQYEFRDGVGGRDRLYRKKLPIESINYLAPTLPPIYSPRLHAPRGE